MIRLVLRLLPGLLLAACQIVAPIEPVATPAATPIVHGSPTPAAVVRVPLVSGGQPTGTPTATPRPTPPPAPTATSTPTPSPTPALPPDARIVLREPLPGEFVAVPFTVTGVVSGAHQGEVRLDLTLPDGQALDIAPVVAATRPVTAGLAFEGMLALELPPTPRQALVRARWSPGPEAEPLLDATQLINLPGSAARVTEVIVAAEVDPATGAINVRGSAPGPPASVLVRLLGPGDAVLEAVEARRAWVAPGLPCAFQARLPRHPDAVLVEALALDAAGTVQDAARARLGP